MATRVGVSVGVALRKTWSVVFRGSQEWSGAAIIKT
jgi:hypothetical protein